MEGTVKQCLSWMALAGALTAMVPLSAMADVYAYVDASGVSHFSSVKLDARYTLFSKSTAGAGRVGVAIQPGSVNKSILVAGQQPEDKTATSPANGEQRLQATRMANAMATYTPSRIAVVQPARATAALGRKGIAETRVASANVTRGQQGRAVPRHSAEAVRLVQRASSAKHVVRKERMHQFASLPRHQERKAHALRYAALVAHAARKQGVDQALVHAVIQVESNYRPGIMSPKGAAGLMQLMPDTAKRFGVRNRVDPAQNIAGGTRYLKTLIRRFKGNIGLAVAAYNAGEGSVMRFGNRIPPFRETQNYVASVLALYHRYSNG